MGNLQKIAGKSEPDKRDCGHDSPRCNLLPQALDQSFSWTSQVPTQNGLYPKTKGLKAIIFGTLEVQAVANFFEPSYGTLLLAPGLSLLERSSLKTSFSPLGLSFWGPLTKSSCQDPSYVFEDLSAFLQTCRLLASQPCLGPQLAFSPPVLSLLLFPILHMCAPGAWRVSG